MRRLCAVLLAVSICACAKTDLIFSDAGSDTETTTDPLKLEPGDLLWAAAIRTGGASDVLALPGGDVVAVGTNGDGAAFFGAVSGEIPVDTAGAFLARYTSAGEIVSVESPILGNYLTVHADRPADGSLSLSGSFSGEATFGPGSPAEIALVPQGDDGYVARFDAAGEMAWVARFAGPGYDSAIDVAALPGGEGLAVGTFGFGSTNEGEPGIATIVDGVGGETPLVSAGGGDLFAAELDSEGSLVWSAIAGGEGEDRAYAVDVRDDGSMVIAGEFGGMDDSSCGAAGYPAVFGGEDAVGLTSAGASDGFVAAYGADRALLWARDIGGPCTDWIRDVVALDDGSIVAVGVIGGPAVFGAGDPNETEIDCGELEACDDMQRFFIASFEPDGDLAWVRTSGFCTDDHIEDTGVDVRANEIARSFNGGEFAIAGAYQGACPFDPSGSGEITLPTTDGTYDPFLAAFTADGAVAWAATGAGACDDSIAAAAFCEHGTLVVGGVYSDDQQFVDLGFPCSASIELGAGEPNETTLPDFTDGAGASGFVAAFAE